ncbi:MAG: hypothetical protein QXT53_00995 [Ignisphaera sp.]
MNKCNDACFHLVDILLRFMSTVDALLREGYVEEARRAGLTGYIVASILSDAYAEAGLTTSDFYNKFRRVLIMFKDLIYSLDTETISITAIEGIRAAFEDIVPIVAVA